jgi:hypothetical protein
MRVCIILSIIKSQGLTSGSDSVIMYNVAHLPNSKVRMSPGAAPVALSMATGPEHLAFDTPVNDLTKNNIQKTSTTNAYVQHRILPRHLRQMSRPNQQRTKDRTSLLTESNDYDPGCRFLLE